MWGSYVGREGGAIGLFSPQLVGVGLLFLGFILLIAGLAASPTERQVRPVVIPKPTPSETPQQPPKVVTTILAICPQCKNRIPADTKFCPQCGADLRPKTDEP